MGIIIALTPFSGFPSAWKEFIYIICGVLIAILSILIRRELHEVLRMMHNDDAKSDTFSQNTPSSKSEDNK